jgi:hypothetical protein
MFRALLKKWCLWNEDNFLLDLLAEGDVFIVVDLQNADTTLLQKKFIVGKTNVERCSAWLGDVARVQALSLLVNRFAKSRLEAAASLHARLRKGWELLPVCSPPAFIEGGWLKGVL